MGFCCFQGDFLDGDDDAPPYLRGCLDSLRLAGLALLLACSITLQILVSLSLSLSLSLSGLFKYSQGFLCFSVKSIGFLSFHLIGRHVQSIVTGGLC
mgnify:CR=1 FL=1